MATSRSWRPSHVLDGPYAASLDEIDELNQVFSEAFTERYRRPISESRCLALRDS
jgi:hypothetical protein